MTTAGDENGNMKLAVEGHFYQLAGMVEYVLAARRSDAVEKGENVENHFPNSPVLLALDLEFW